MDPIETAAVRDDMERLHMVSREGVVQAAHALVRVAEETMRWRAEQARQALADGQAAAATAAARFRVERDLAAATWEARLRDPSWFADAPVGEILQTWTSAEGWAQTGDPRAAATCERLRLEVRRLGVDPDLAQSAVAARDVQALTDLLDVPGQDAPGAAGQEVAGGRDGDGSGPPTFAFTVFEHEALNSKQLSKEEALAHIERATGPTDPARAGEYFSDIDGWAGKDRDVDVALAGKWPDRYRAPAVTNTDPGRAVETRTRARSGTRGRGGVGDPRREALEGADLKIMSDLISTSMHATEAEAILADPNWPRVAAQLRRAQAKIDGFNAQNPSNKVDVPELLGSLQFNRPAGELRTPAGWLIWQLHNATAARGVQLVAESHPDGHRVRTRHAATPRTRGSGRGRARDKTARRDPERGS